MAAPAYLLHPSVRERPQPRMSATALAEYLILRADQQEKVLHDSRWSRPPIVSAYADAFRALRAYNCDPARPQSALERVKEALLAKSTRKDIKPRAKDEALRCIEVIDLFIRHENAFGVRAMALRESPNFPEIMVEGVAISIQPDFLIDAKRSDGRQYVGAGILRLAKAPDPDACRLEQTRQSRGEHRREMGRYLVAMLQMLLEAQDGRLGEPHRDLCLVADVRLGERIGAASDHTARRSTIRAGCAQIASLWFDLKPRPSILRKKP